MSSMGSFFPRRTSQYVPSMQYSSDVSATGMGSLALENPIAANATGIIAAQSIATAGSVAAATTFDPNSMGKFGRVLQVKASIAATSNVTVNGRDYLGQALTESFTLAGTTPVIGKKAFKLIDRITFGVTAAATIDVGWGNVLGLPYRIIDMFSELVSGIEATAAGTIQLPVSVQTSTSGDPRGTYTPAGANIPDGIRRYTIVGLWDRTNLHGERQFYA